MNNQIKQFKTLVEQAKVILITSHISPDPDAVCSVLLMGTALKANFPDKKIEMVLEETPANDLSFLTDFSGLKFKNVLVATENFKPDLFILLDSGNLKRCSRNEAAQLRQFLKKSGCATIIIDHHEEEGREEVGLYINNHRPATVQEIYELLFNQLHFKKPDGYAQTALLGIISDTARHKFDNPYHRITYAIVSDLLDAGASIEQLETRMERYSSDELEVLNNLISHITDSGRGYTYSFVDDDFSKKWAGNDRSVDAFKRGCDIFTAQFLKNFKKNMWGFMVHPDLVAGKGNYSVSFRAVGGVKDVSKLALALGGGGHKPAAGARGIMASDVKSAVKFVQSVIEEPRLVK